MRIAYSNHAYRRMKHRRLSHAEVKRILGEPKITYPGKAPNSIVARGFTDDGRSAGVVYTEHHDRDADLLIITVIDFGEESRGDQS